jgi:uncharacterized protein
MPLAEDIVTSRHRFSSYDPESVTINEDVYRHSLVLTASDIHHPWPVTSIADLGTDNLAIIFETNPAVVLLGTGEQQRFPDARTFVPCSANAASASKSWTTARCAAPSTSSSPKTAPSPPPSSSAADLNSARGIFPNGNRYYF